MAKRPYYNLLVREDGRWSPEFGDHNRLTVKAEFDYYRERYKAKDLKIIKLPSYYLTELEAALAKLNGATEAQPPRSETEPQCYVSVQRSGAEGVIFLTVPEDAKAGERVAIHASPKALRRISAEIAEVLECK